MKEAYAKYGDVLCGDGTYRFVRYSKLNKNY